MAKCTRISMVCTVPHSPVKMDTTPSPESAERGPSHAATPMLMSSDTPASNDEISAPARQPWKWREKREKFIVTLRVNGWGESRSSWTSSLSDNNGSWSFLEDVKLVALGIGDSSIVWFIPPSGSGIDRWDGLPMTAKVGGL